MKIVKPSYLINFLNEENLRAKKSFSQNFLIDGNIVRKILKAANIQANDVVIEIGPGPGALTEALLEAGAIVIAIELDKGFGGKLERMQTEDGRLHVMQADALSLDYEKILLPHLKGEKKAKLVANLPYAITTPILAKILPLYSLFEKATVMIQKEMADRIKATSGEHYSSLSVFTSIYATFAYEFTVEPTCFMPKPKVRSSVVSFTLKETPHDIDIFGFLGFMRKAFNQRRKMLSTIFKDQIDKESLHKALEDLGLKSTARAEEIIPSNFLKLFKKLEAFFSNAKEEDPQDMQK